MYPPELRHQCPPVLLTTALLPSCRLHRPWSTAPAPFPPATQHAAALLVAVLDMLWQPSPTLQLPLSPQHLAWPTAAHSARPSTVCALVWVVGSGAVLLPRCVLYSWGGVLFGSVAVSVCWHETKWRGNAYRNNHLDCVAPCLTESVWGEGAV